MNTTAPLDTGRYHQQDPKLTAIESLKIYGVTKNLIRYHSLNEFHIPAGLLPCFQTYNVLHWRSDYCLEQIKDGVITREGKHFIVVFNACTRYKVKQSSDAVLSFREAQSAYDLPAYVLIKPI